MIKAIETVYRGIQMRSRSEARWATFFDALEVEWEYEPEHFDLGLKNPGFDHEDADAIRDLYEDDYDEDEIRREIWYAKNEKLYYLPDFYLSEFEHWVEVKGKSPNAEEKRKARGLAYRTGKPVTIVYGQLPDFGEGFQTQVFRSDLNIVALLIIKYGEGSVQRAAFDARHMRFDRPLKETCIACGVVAPLADSSVCKECWCSNKRYRNE